MSTETWYVLEDGTYADPAEVTPDRKGVLRSKSGVAVAMRGDVPSTRSIDADEERKRQKPKAREAEPAKAHDEPLKSDRQMKAEGGHGYKTRSTWVKESRR